MANNILPTITTDDANTPSSNNSMNTPQPMNAITPQEFGDYNGELSQSDGKNVTANRPGNLYREGLLVFCIVFV